MAITYNPLLEGFDYIPLDQRQDPQPFKVTLKTITSKELLRMQDGLLQKTADDALTLKSGTFAVNVCKASIINWDNLLDKTGKQEKIDLDASGTISFDALNKLPIYYFEEIANVVTTVSQDASTLKLFVPEKKDEKE